MEDSDVSLDAQVIADDECDQAIEYAAKREAANQEHPPAWCFEKRAAESVEEAAKVEAALKFDNQKPDRVSQRQLSGLYRCAEDEGLGRSHAFDSSSRRGAVMSTSVVVQQVAANTLPSFVLVCWLGKDLAVTAAADTAKGPPRMQWPPLLQEGLAPCRRCGIVPLLRGRHCN